MEKTNDNHNKLEKMKKILSTATLAIMAGMVLAQGGSITNINPAQRTDGSKIVDIYYDLSGPDTVYSIMVEVSLTGGSSYISATNTTGDAGPGVTPGTGKYIVWDFGTQFPLQYSAQTKIKLTAYKEVNWACGDMMFDSRDDQGYATVLIGSQCWMAENLNMGTRIHGNIPQENNGVFEKYCFQNNPDNCNVYGGLYQWNEVMQYSSTPGVQGICPSGWHVPTDVEWCTLEQYVDPTITCDALDVWRGVDGGGKLKEAGTAHWAAPNTGATNLSGFTALPGGEWFDYGRIFSGWKAYGFFWTSTPLANPNSIMRALSYQEATIARYSNPRLGGFSVRCLLD